MNNGVGVDRKNLNFMKKIDENEVLGITMGCQIYSPYRKKYGTELNLVQSMEKLKDRKLCSQSKIVPVINLVFLLQVASQTMK